MANLTGTITGAISFSATAAVLKTFVLSITQVTGNTITVKAGSSTGSALANGATVSYGQKIWIGVTADAGYPAGTLSVTGATKNDDGTYTVTGAVTVTVTGVSKNKYTVTITQSAHQTIHVWVPSKGAAGAVDHTTTFTAEHGTTYEAEIVADTGYTAGTLSVK